MAKLSPYNPLEGERPLLNIDLSGDSLDEQISIIVVHKDRPAYLSICLQTIAVCSVNYNTEIIIVDNNSGKETQDFLNQLEDDNIKIIKNDKNQYWTKAANQGAKAADKNSSYLVFMHADTCILNPVWLDLLVGVSESEDSGLVGVQMSSYKMNDQKIDFVNEWCMLTTRKCWDDIGPFNEALPHNIGSPFLFTLAAQSKSYKPRCIKTPIVHHYHTSSLDISTFERFAEQASVEIPNQLKQMPYISKLVGSN